MMIQTFIQGICLDWIGNIGANKIKVYVQCSVRIVKFV